MVVTSDVEYFNNRSDPITNPQIIAEVLSESSTGYDREDIQAYRTIATFEEYLLIDQTQIRVEQFAKIGEKRWELREYDAEDDAIALATLPFEISLLDLYNKVFAAADVKDAVVNAEEIV